MNTPQSIAYSVTAQSTGGRGGQAVTTDPELTLDLRAPQELGGPGGGANPEQLFAMGYGACFQGAMGLAAKELGTSTTDSVVRTTVGIGPEGDSFAISVNIEVYIPGVPRDEVQRLADRTHELCPYSKATRGNVPVTVTAIESL
ncbi:organic hydroperoxide resistance protein [Schaalia sp. ZJ405]|uniref:organic hydroperoxide resistance protein n=1 Tax=unclassified Schaalia TaxID=2691889 RepID=UPI0013EC9F3F|nr:MULTISPECIES: organic hydroperoxide resistance protein [unclassified Schaalia]QPK81073.1 organic hydroperoxide resistance protein [Schaalia sp. ZJ405]